jgi:hypothetical protein
MQPLCASHYVLLPSHDTTYMLHRDDNSTGEQTAMRYLLFGDLAPGTSANVTDTTGVYLYGLTTDGQRVVCQRHADFGWTTTVVFDHRRRVMILNDAVEFSVRIDKQDARGCTRVQMCRV